MYILTLCFYSLWAFQFVKNVMTHDYANELLCLYSFLLNYMFVRSRLQLLPKTHLHACIFVRAIRSRAMVQVNYLASTRNQASRVLALLGPLRKREAETRPESR